MSAMQFLLYMGWPAITCLVLGLGLMIYEMFTPGFAVPGITGLILLVLSVVLTAQSLSQALIMIVLILIVLSLVFVIALRSAMSGRLSRSPLVLKERATKEEGYLSTQDMNYFVGPPWHCHDGAPSGWYSGLKAVKPDGGDGRRIH